MSRRFCAIFIVCFYACTASAERPTADQLLASSAAQADNKQFDQALQTLGQAEKLEPDNVEVKLEIARIHGWQGNYAEAEQEVGILSAANPDSADIQSLSAYLDYYQGRDEAAETKFTQILQTYPAYTDAADGLKLAQDAGKSEKADAAYLWQFDTGYEHSSFARQPQSDWSNEYAQITRLFDGSATAVHGRFEYYDEFQTTNAYYEIGIDHRFTPWLNGYLYGGHTAAASFRPAWRTETGGNLRVYEDEKSARGVWLTLDVKQDEYNQVSIATTDPGLRLEAGDWALSPNLVMVHQWGMPSIFGWNARLDGPVYQDLHFYAGYSDAPDTENAVTVYTASFYGGLSYAFDGAHTVGAGYTHDDRQNSYIRHAININFSYRL